MSGTVTNLPEIQPTAVQVWQANTPVDWTDECSTEQPVAFVIPGTGGQAVTPAATEYPWRYCIQGQYLARINQVPWIYADGWSYTERKRRYITEPRVWDFSLTVRLDDPRTQKLLYPRPTGWTILVYSGDILLGRQWVAISYQD